MPQFQSLLRVMNLTQTRVIWMMKVLIWIEVVQIEPLLPRLHITNREKTATLAATRKMLQVGRKMKDPNDIFLLN